MSRSCPGVSLCPGVPPCPRSVSPPRTRGHAPHGRCSRYLPAHWPSRAPPSAAIGRRRPAQAEARRFAGRWRSAAMALALALLWQALGRVWRSPGSSARHAPPSRAMEHDRAIEVYDIIRTIRDPEKPNTLEELEVVTENCVEVQEIGEDEYLVIIRHKLEIYISEGTHSTEEDINKQINDKERVAAAMENPNLREIVEQCVTEPD